MRLIPGGPTTLLDIGCGTGTDLLFWTAQGVHEADLAGTELVNARASIASDALPRASIVTVEGFDLPFDDSRFSATTASLVLSSIPDAHDRRLLFSEMLRVTKPGGVVAIYDFRIRKPSNRFVVAMTAREAARLGGSPDERWAAGPLMPAADLALRLPPVISKWVIAALPRTHVMYVWRR
jgi:ubiquinone/menaquinone biosynthesis C-methylase UbiE